MGSEEPIHDMGAEGELRDWVERSEGRAHTVDHFDNIVDIGNGEMQIGKALYSDTNDEHDSSDDMSRLFDSDGGDRYRIVNWSNLCRSKSEGPQTLEFRQADGTLDEQDVIHWVHLISTVIRTCEHLANSADPQSIWLNSNRKDVVPSLTELLDLLDIHDIAIRWYWEQRVKKYTGRIDEFTPELKDWEVCGLCALHHDGRLRGRRRRAAFTRGYRHLGHMKRKDKSSAKRRQ
jgi:Putative amidoligase enzyme